MAIYAIGDIQGCYDALNRLLDKIGFDMDNDQLWFVGDIVNRGPQSLQALRFVRSLGDRAICVLGNHDLNLLAVSADIRSVRNGDTLLEIINAPDANELLHWLRNLPLVHYDKKLNTAMVHAGIPPKWGIKASLKRSREIQSILSSPEYISFLEHMYGDTPNKWSKKLEGWDRLRFITNALTRMRYCDSKGRLDLNEKHKPGSQPEHLKPWFQHAKRKASDTRIIFGHWSTLGFVQTNNVIALDTGCVWGGTMTAVRIDSGSKTPQLISVDCETAQQPGFV